MSAELFFIYDSHCPWSYASTSLVEAITQAFPEIELHLWHCARYEGDEQIGNKTLEQVELDSNVIFTSAYKEQCKNAVDSTIAANLLAWVANKIPENTLPLLTTIQEQHFEQGNPLKSADDFDAIIEQYKLSPPAKVLKNDKYTKEAEYTLTYIEEIQEVIGTQAIPALLLAVNNDLVLLNHNLYLKDPSAIIEAVKLELAK
ncbi:protein-disulfide isomerase [Thalassotalea piscium]